MAHWEQLEFVRRVRRALPEYFDGRRVLEIGSGEIVDSVRASFENCEYLGVDVAPGRSVDRVCPGQDVDEPTASFDVVISCECFEHNPWWRETWVNMLRMLKPDGIAIVSCALTGRQEHGTRRMDPGATLQDGEAYRDYYRNLSPRELIGLVDPDRQFGSWINHANIFKKDLYFVGLRHDAEEAHHARMDDLETAIRAIRREKPLGPLKAAAGRLDYGLKRSLAVLLGEDGFHDAKYALRSGSRRALGALIGRDRVERFRERRRAAKGPRRRDR